MAYAHVSLRLQRDRAAHRTLADRLYANDALAGAEVVGVFAPLLGYATNEAMVLIRADGAVSDATIDQVLKAPGVTGGEAHRLRPTIRPVGKALPKVEGVYVMRWFTIDAEAMDEFVRLSGEAWPHFEGGFDTTIYGLFEADRTDADRASGAANMLLLTQYGDLSVWQASRSPSTEARSAFARRQELTRVALPRACTLMPRP